MILVLMQVMLLVSVVVRIMNTVIESDNEDNDSSANAGYAPCLSGGEDNEYSDSINEENDSSANASYAPCLSGGEDNEYSDRIR